MAGANSPLYEFRRYAVRTNETYLIAAAAIAAALSLAEGTQRFEALAGWEEPLPLEGEGATAVAVAGRDVAPPTTTSHTVTRAGEEIGGEGGAARGVGFSIEEVRGAALLGEL